jgi:16S rRNA (adenine1518-N6/adenine1519-N6)-dimethyltransferase
MTLTRKERIVARLQEVGAEPKRSLGQNFLISNHIVERIIAAVKAEPCSQMIEVGPGLGALTEDLIELQLPLVLLELDAKFINYWTERARAFDTGSEPQVSVASHPVSELRNNLTSHPGLRVIAGDALKINWPELALKPETLFVSNLPYQISSSIVIDRSVEPAGVSRMILMFQKEVAQRLMAEPRTKEYGLLTVIAQTFWKIRTVCDAGPNDFFPPPNVSSRVLSFQRLSPEPLDGTEAAGFLRFVKSAFSHRRKLMSRNLLQDYFGGKAGLLPEIEAVFTTIGLTRTARAEELDPRLFVRLYLSLRGLKS